MDSPLRRVMLLCPECEQPYINQAGESCASCKVVSVNCLNKIFVALSSTDKKKSLFKDYMDIYDRVAVEDLCQSFQHIEYIEIQTKKLFNYLPKKKGMSICEIGVGQGCLLKKLASLAPSRLVGVDIASAYLQKLIQDNVCFEPFLANAENLPFLEEFDMVISTDVLEHVLCLGDYLCSVYRSLKKGGVFVVRAPYLEDYTFYSRFKGHKYNMMHLRNFSKKTLNIVLSGAGFSVKTFRYDGFEEWRFRSWIPWLIQKLIGRSVRLFKDSPVPLANVSNGIGRLLMRPEAITAICIKV